MYWAVRVFPQVYLLTLTQSYMKQYDQMYSTASLSLALVLDLRRSWQLAFLFQKGNLPKIFSQFPEFPHPWKKNQCILKLYLSLHQKHEAPWKEYKQDTNHTLPSTRPKTSLVMYTKAITDHLQGIFLLVFVRFLNITWDWRAKISFFH